ncbi:hypothetical protein DICPUDRAFT_157290 [Dictyostelium purpureum]|uniref:16S rRNA (uracil(1498)-N(3))-methyltransferase n=1 Tax=Dictyostelium purpureum TaxID=5786 RepID=F0ZYR3_DICPU|nr:uncharacterized protein DICPUDRAFT_157290 [Dictyostelium purpureum]EGC30925.1 hypothetical protein DICPUDRAFT_157290 [Dictyostelium purpureum]|eukprot:XP_003292554.1 hypothetical protein DICPUDRAFT_157290 [Dictyostelium purpureum]
MVRRFFINEFPSFLKGSILQLSGQQNNHVKTLRLKVGNTIELFDSNGKNGVAKIIEINKNETILQLENLGIESTNSEEINKIDIATSLPKLARAEWMIEKLSEIGISNLILLETEFSKSSPQSSSITNNKLDRFERIVIESSKQSRNNQIMNIIPPVSLNQFLKDRFINQKEGDCKYSHVFIGDPYQGKELPLVLDDIKQEQQQLQQKQPQQPQQPQQQSNKAIIKKPKDILLFIGAEGGFSDRELYNIQSVVSNRNDSQLYLTKMGNNILRMETAAILSSGIVKLNLPFLFNYKNK